MHWVCSSHAHAWCLPSLCFFLLSSPVCPHCFPRRFCFDFHVLYVILPFCMLFYASVCVCAYLKLCMSIMHCLIPGYQRLVSWTERSFAAGVPMYSVQRGDPLQVFETSQWHCHCLEFTDSSTKFTSVLVMWGGLSVAVWLSEIPGESLYNMASCDVTMVSSG